LPHALPCAGHTHPMPVFASINTTHTHTHTHTHSLPPPPNTQGAHRAHAAQGTHAAAAARLQSVHPAAAGAACGAWAGWLAGWLVAVWGRGMDAARVALACAAAACAGHGAADSCTCPGGDTLPCWRAAHTHACACARAHAHAHAHAHTDGGACVERGAAGAAPRVQQPAGLLVGDGQLQGHHQQRCVALPPASNATQQHRTPPSRFPAACARTASHIVPRRHTPCTHTQHPTHR
jgi:hypothetical protein